jgi:ADP-ribose pyrophosphatase
MAQRIHAIDDEIHKCMNQLQGMGAGNMRSMSSIYNDQRKLEFPLGSFANPVPYDHIKAQGKEHRSDTTNRPYRAKDGSTIERGDLSFDGTHHYWANYFSDPSLHTLPKPDWADYADTNHIVFNSIDNKVDRTSHHGPYALMPYVFENSNSGFRFGKFPINPVGKTGITGRGQLGKWGPNHAADPIMMTRKADGIYFVSIMRKDTGNWGLPGGMVEVGDNVSVTLRNEFGEEAMNTLEMTLPEKERTKKMLEKVFSGAKLVYKGYVDDPRNTDNAWMETVAMLIEVDPVLADQFILNAGDDAGKVKWLKYVPGLDLYASHAQLIDKAIELMKKGA